MTLKASTTASACGKPVLVACLLAWSLSPVGPSALAWAEEPALQPLDEETGQTSLERKFWGQQILGSG